MNGNQQLNASLNDSTTTATRETVLLVVESYFFVLLNIVALVGNSLVCVAFYRKKSLRTVTNYFVLSLALADLSMAVVAMPLSSISSIANEWYTGEFGCQIRDFCAHVLGGTSVVTLMLLAINRRIRCASPMLYYNIYSKRNAIVMAICAWFATVVVVIILFAVTGTQMQVFTYQPSWCFLIFRNEDEAQFYGIVFTIYITVPSLVVVVCYVKIYQTIRQYNISAAPPSQGENSAYGVEEAKITRILTFVIVGFYLCWLPPLITNIFENFIVLGEVVVKYYNFYYTFPLFTSSVINPVIYATMNQHFRKEFKKTLYGYQC